MAKEEGTGCDNLDLAGNHNAPDNAPSISRTYFEVGHFLMLIHNLASCGLWLSNSLQLID